MEDMKDKKTQRTVLITALLTVCGTLLVNHLVNKYYQSTPIGSKPDNKDKIQID